MTYIHWKTSEFLKTLQKLPAKNGEQRWSSLCKRRIYTWDGQHGEIEVFNTRGNHLGVLDATTGLMVKDPVQGRTIDV